MNEDTLFYCISPSDKSFRLWVFDDFSSLLPETESVITGKPIYYYNKHNCNFDTSEFKQKIIHNEKYINLIYSYDRHTGLKSNSTLQIKQLICDELQGRGILCPYEDNIFTKPFVAFKNEYVCEKSEPRTALSQLKQKNHSIYEIIQQVSEEFGVSEHQVGITGSLALGAEEYNDLDLVFYGSITEINNIKERIRKYIKKNGSVYESGLHWPCRYYNNDGYIICCFFNILDDDYLSFIKNSNYRITEKKVQFSVQVSDDTYSIAKMPLLFLQSRIYDSLVITSRAFRNVFHNGDIINGMGYVLEKENGKQSIICTEPFLNIFDYTNYFNR